MAPTKPYTKWSSIFGSRGEEIDACLRVKAYLYVNKELIYFRSTESCRADDPDFVNDMCLNIYKSGQKSLLVNKARMSTREIKIMTSILQKTEFPVDLMDRSMFLYYNFGHIKLEQYLDISAEDLKKLQFLKLCDAKIVLSTDKYANKIFGFKKTPCDKHHGAQWTVGSLFSWPWQDDGRTRQRKRTKMIKISINRIQKAQWLANTHKNYER